MHMHCFDYKSFRSLYLLLGSGCLLCCTLAIEVQAQVRTNITADPTMGTVVDPDLKIRGGMRPGNGDNLLHSFLDFIIGSGDTAHFLDDTGVERIIARVTGSNTSIIDGGLKSDATLFFLNPNGVIFGPNARIRHFRFALCEHSGHDSL